MFCSEECSDKFDGWFNFNKEYIDGFSSKLGISVKLDGSTNLCISHAKKHKDLRSFVEDYRLMIDESRKNVAYKLFVRGVIKGQ